MYRLRFACGATYEGIADDPRIGASHARTDGTLRYAVADTDTDVKRPKLEANRERDTKILARLKDEGWLVLVIWECELGDLAPLTARIDQFLKEAS